MRPIAKIIVHCSASPDAMDIGFKEVNQWHLERGWKSPAGVHCGYHYLIRRHGVIEVGRMPHEVGAHVEGENQNSIGICLIGTHEFLEAQIISLKRLVDGLAWMFPGARVFGHREFESAKKQKKTCPNIDVHSILGL